MKLVYVVLLLSFVNFCIGCKEDRWTKEDTSGPRPKNIGGFSFTERSGKLYLFGGVNDNLTGNVNTFSNQLHKFNPNNNQWSLVDNGSGPSPRSYHSAIYDPIKDRLLVYGGIIFDATFQDITVFDDMWEWKFATNSWHRLNISGSPGFRARQGTAVLGGKMYFFSGLINGNFEALNDLWRFDLSCDTWELLIPNGNPASPLPRGVMQFVPLISQNRIYLNGGQVVVAPFFEVANDTWVYNPVTNTWTDITPPIQFNMNPGHNEHDSGNFFGNKLYLYGGEIPGGTDGCGSLFAQNPNNETWYFDARPSKQKWVNVSNTLRVTPPPLKRHGGRRVDECLYIYGGYSWNCPGVGQTFNNDVWSLKIRD